MRAVVAFLRFLRPSQAVIASFLPVGIAALICTVLKTYQLQAYGEDMYYQSRLVTPELSVFPLIAGVGLILFQLLPARWHRPVQALVCTVLFMLILLLTLDTASIYIRYAPIHYVEFKKFLDAPGQLWPVVSSQLSTESLVKSTAAFAGLAAVLGGVGWFAAKPRVETPRPRLVTGLSLLVYSSLLLFTWSTLAERRLVPLRHRKLQVSVVERLARGLMMETRRIPTGEVKPFRPLVIDRGAQKAPFNIILLVYESTGRSATSLHPSNRTLPESTPFLRELAEGGLEASDTYTTVTHTSKALIGILCGQHPYPLARDRIEISVFLNTCLPEALTQGGYRTGFFQAPTLQFEHRDVMTKLMGFQTVQGGDSADPTGFAHLNYFGYEDRIILKPALEWVKQTAEPYFLTIMSGTTHHPYGSPGHPVADGTQLPHDEARALHRIGLRYVDDFFRDVVRGIEAARGLKNTLIIAVGDHGEAFGEHGLKFHDFVPYEQAVKVPLVVWGPEVLTPERVGRSLMAGTRIDGLRHVIDIMPTLLNLEGWSWSEGSLPGRPLLDLEGHASVMSSCLSPNQCMMMRDKQYKYIQHEWYLNDRLEVYDVLADPDELRDLASTLPPPLLREKQLEMWNTKEQLIAQYDLIAKTRPRAELPEEDQTNLSSASLRYLGIIPTKAARGSRW